MIDMIASLRAFEAGQKVIQTIDRSLEQTTGKVGSKH
jgi:flagellar basal-body rod protein FlgF